MSQMLEQTPSSWVVDPSDETSMSDPKYFVMPDIPLPTDLANNNKKDENDYNSVLLMELLNNTEDMKNAEMVREAIDSFFSKANNNSSSAVVRIHDIEESNRELLRKLEKIKNTPEDERWPDADWPTEQAFLDAKIFIQKLPIHSIPMPSMGLAHDGEVNFLWKNDGVHIDLGFYGTGSYSYFARDKDGKEFGAEAIPASNGLPSKIIDFFTT